MLSNIHLYTIESEEKNQKVKKNPYHLNKLECCFFEYLYTFIRENRIQDENISVGVDEFSQVMGYLSGSDNNIRKAVTSLGEQKFQDGSGNLWSLYEIKNLTARDRQMELRLSEQFLKLDRPYCGSKLLAGYMTFEKYYSKVIFLYLLGHKPDQEFDDSEVYRFTIGREEGESEYHNLYRILCSDLTHCGIIPPMWEKNFGYFDKTVLEPCLKEIKEKAQISISYDKSKMDTDGKRHRQNKQMLFNVQGRDVYLLANLSNPFRKAEVSISKEEFAETVEAEEQYGSEVEYVAQKEEVTVSTPENMEDIYPESYRLLLGYNIDPQNASGLIIASEKHMSTESYKKRDKWVKRYLQYYLRIICPNGRADRLDVLQRHIEKDNKNKKRRL